MIASNERAHVIVAGVGHMVFPDLPLTYEGMQLLVPVEIRNKEHAKHKAVYGLIQAMARQLDDARMVSTIPPGQYLTGYKEEQDQVQTLFRIKGIQQEMSAVRFRMEINDYRGTVEKVILENRMLELYELAKQLDPTGVAQFERMIDKRMKKVRIRGNGNYRGN
ncbi:MAG: hypothetical protein HDR09_13050 [Lachnospiraceae bacterium]|nr:hypothetical protein [Lachnospiraceae bacterium]